MNGQLARLIITLCLLVFMVVCMFLNKLSDTLIIMISSAILGYWFGYHDRGYQEYRNGCSKNNHESEE